MSQYTNPSSDTSASIPDAGSSMVTSISTRSRRQRAPAPRGVSLGLEEEVDFGSDEDLMENVGEINVPVTHNWYPGKPDSPPPTKNSKKGKSKQLADIPESGFGGIGGIGASKSSLSINSSKSRPSLLGRREKAKGLGDARLVMPEELRPGGDGRREKEKEKKQGRFGKLFGKKKDDDASIMGARSITNDSVSSFGSVSKYSHASSSAAKSILVTSSHVPPNHTPTSKASTDPSSSLPSIPTTPFSVDHEAMPIRRGHGHHSMPSGSSDSPLIREMGRPGVMDDTGHSDHTFESYDMGMTTKEVKVNPGLGLSMSDAGHGSKQMALGTTNTVPKMETPVKRPPAISTNSNSSGDVPRIAAPRGAYTGVLLPTYPASETALEGITILSTTVMRRMPPSQLTPNKGTKFRPSTGNSITAFGSRKPTWQTHQLVLTSFRAGESAMPSPNVDVETPHERQTSTTKTIAHLHLFAYNNPPKTPTRPGSAGASSTLSGGTPKKRLGSLEGATKVEVDRQAIGPLTSAGVWEMTDQGDFDTSGRKWILRVKSAEDLEEWLCDMPTGDTLFEWIRQIKAYATVIKAETLGFGRAIRSAHSAGLQDLNLELELHEQGLKTTPKASLQPAFIDPDTDTDTAPGEPALDDTPVPETPATLLADRDDHQTMIAQKDAYDSSSVPAPITMHDFLTRKSLSPRGQDLATFLDTADLEWRLKQAEIARAGQLHPQYAGTSRRESLTGSQNGVSRTKSDAGRATSASRGTDGVRRETSMKGLDVASTSRPSSGSSNGRSYHLPPAVPPPSGPPPPVPAPLGRPPAVPPPTASLPPVPPPNMPLPDTPQLVSDDRPEVVLGSATTSSPITPALLTDPTTLGDPIGIPQPAQYPRTKSSPSDSSGSRFFTPAKDIAGLSKLSVTDYSSIDTPKSATNGADVIEELVPPRSIGRQATSDSLSAMGNKAYMDDSASISSKGSSARRKYKKPQPVDLMAELSGRPEMNYEKPAEMKEGTEPIDENRPRKIRFG